MARYINLDIAIKHLRGKCVSKYPLSYSNGICASANELLKLPIADVAPKSEVAREIFEEIERLIELYTVNTPLYMPFSYIDVLFVHFVAELKKKYTEE